MNKTVNVNVGGRSFNIEENAYKILDSYLDSIKDCYRDNCNSNEIISDIEARIGELLYEIKKGCEVVTTAMVECVKQRIGSPDDLKADEEEAEEDNASAEAPKKIKRKLYRDMSEKHIAGVCSGLAAFFDIDAVWMRLTFCLLFFGGLFTDWKWIFEDGRFGMVILLLYCLLWICIPEAKTVRQRCEMRGEPLRLDEFHSYVPQSETVVKRRRSTLANILCDILGIILMIFGITTSMLGIGLPPFGQSVFAENSYNININGVAEPWISYVENGLVMLDGHIFWWLAGIHLLVLGLWSGYAGLKLALKLKSPKWHPGLIFFLLWLISIIALAGYCSVSVFFGGFFLN